MNRYAKMFDRLSHKNEAAFIPFVVIGDPNPEWSLDIIRTLIDSGADALELGLAFSDPVADGPVIQRADLRVMSLGMKTADALLLVKEIRKYNAEIPIGILTYANIVMSRGIGEFYAQLREAGVDSLLIADVPTLEIGTYLKSASTYQICQVMIVPPNIDEDRLKKIAEISSGYVYVVTRSGVTGVNETLGLSSQDVFMKLKKLNAAPGIYGFGISTPAHVQQACQAGASGAISGSAVTQIIEKNLYDKNKLLKDLAHFTEGMKRATQ